MRTRKQIVNFDSEFLEWILWRQFRRSFDASDWVVITGALEDAMYEKISGNLRGILDEA